jgi:hypothetical protein
MKACERLRELRVAHHVRVAQGERSSRTDSSKRAHGTIGIGRNIRESERGKLELTYWTDAELGGGFTAFDPSAAD